MESRKMLSTRQAADILDVDVRTVVRWLNSEKLAGEKRDRVWMVNAAAIEALKPSKNDDSDTDADKVREDLDHHAKRICDNDLHIGFLLEERKKQDAQVAALADKFGHLEQAVADERKLLQQLIKRLGLRVVREGNQTESTQEEPQQTPPAPEKWWKRWPGQIVTSGQQKVQGAVRRMVRLRSWVGKLWRGGGWAPHSPKRPPLRRPRRAGSSSPLKGRPPSEGRRRRKG